MATAKKTLGAYALYSLFIIGSVIWAVWEAGFYWWALATRLGFPLIFGLLMLLPWVAKKMGDHKSKILTAPAGNTLHTPQAQVPLKYSRLYPSR
nr:hypothetical protein [Psychrobacter sp. PraFG1]UNK04860.1 hypothetical protein MN210_12010 [Psychrobacter sp. PraFG1]